MKESLVGIWKPGVIARLLLSTTHHPMAYEEKNIPTIGGDDFGRRIECTLAAEAGAAMATFLLGFAPPSASLFLFFAPGSAMVEDWTFLSRYLRNKLGLFVMDWTNSKRTPPTESGGCILSKFLASVFCRCVGLHHPF